MFSFQLSFFLQECVQLLANNGAVLGLKWVGDKSSLDKVIIIIITIIIYPQSFISYRL